MNTKFFASIWVIFLLSLLGCKPISKHTEEKFIPFQSMNDFWFSGKSLLINKLDKRVWKVVYGFEDNKNCARSFWRKGDFTAAHEKQIHQNVEKALALWVEPLNVKLPKIEFEKKDTVKRSVAMFASIIRTRKFLFADDEKPDLALIFYCQKGRSYMENALLTSETLYTSPSKLDTYTIVSMFQSPNPHDRGLTELNRYHMATLMHEVGHSFGLGDSYTEHGVTKRHAISDGIDPVTSGTQPIAIMGVARYISHDPETGEIRLGEDDIAGIKWIYRYNVKKDLTESDCPVDFFYERSTFGCSPKYPLIFVVKQGYFNIFQRLMKMGRSIDVNRQDTLGNTPLHYAAIRERDHDNPDMCLVLIGTPGIKPDIKNNAGQTAADLAGTNSECFKRRQP